MICYLLKLCAASLFSAGLAAHSNRFTGHHRSVYFYLVVFIVFLALSLAGLISIATYERAELKTDPKTNWLPENDPPFIYFPNEVFPETSPWFEIEQFKINETCYN